MDSDQRKNNIAKRRRWVLSLLLSLIIILAGYISVFYFPGYLWLIMLPFTFIYFIVLGIMVPANGLKVFFFSISAVFLALLLFEYYLFLNKDVPKNSQMTGTVTEPGFNEEHPFLGYGLKDDGVFTAKRSFLDETIYDVSYTVKNGLRFTPNSNDTGKCAALFFGCSFTFGEGISDTSTLPYLFNQYAGNEFKVFNYGFSGYGPHQMLATIENRANNDISGCNKTKIAVYSFIPDHVARASGRRDFCSKGPKYEIVDGVLKKTGTFSKSLFQRAVEYALSQSYTYHRLFPGVKPSTGDWKLTSEIIKKAHELLSQQGVAMYVFIWDYPGFENEFKKKADYDHFIDELKRNQIPLFFLHDAIPDYGENTDNYIIKDDRHPNHQANEKIAAYLYTHISDIRASVNMVQEPKK